MSDVSKTNDLIAEARRWRDSQLPASPWGDGHIVNRLADALESATRVLEQGEASAAIERVRAIHKREVIAVHPGVGEEAWCPACQEHWPCSTTTALDGAPEPEAGTKVVIGKQNRGDDDESWTFTEWEPFELEKAREEFPNSVYEVVTVFGLPVEGESDD